MKSICETIIEVPMNMTFQTGDNINNMLYLDSSSIHVNAMGSYTLVDCWMSPELVILTIGENRTSLVSVNHCWNLPNSGSNENTD